jgi:23S rRNA (cytidine1920-2'-O)/16S rRNA (cytidine1409-2'-O)-methyltransferase
MPRLDQLLVDQGHYPSREKAKRAVMAGVVWVEGRLVDKPGTKVSEEVDLELRETREPFVSRGGRKIASALDHFDLDPTGMNCLDVGASTGGFTDCLLQRGAERVVALDVGRGQLDYRLRQDPRVEVMEGVNARYLTSEDLGEHFDLIVADLSFISLVKVVPALIPFLEPGGILLVLVKPQFEVGKGQVGKGGIVRDDQVRRRVVDERCQDLASLGLKFVGIVDSEVSGAKGNQETFALFRRAQ